MFLKFDLIFFYELIFEIPNRFETSSAMTLAMANDEVAAGEGALRT